MLSGSTNADLIKHINLSENRLEFYGSLLINKFQEVSIFNQALQYFSYKIYFYNLNFTIIIF